MTTPGTISQAHLAAARAVDSLRRQLPIVFMEDNRKMTGAVPVEGLTLGLLEALHALPQSRLQLLITAARARHLRLEAPSAGTVRIDAQNLSLSLLHTLADPLADPAAVPALTASAATPAQEMLLTLTKYAALLPAVLLVESATLPADWTRIAMQDVQGYWRNPQLDIVPLAQAALPIAGAEQATVTCFRERHGTSVHLALSFGDLSKSESPLVRVHSSCITGDILGSLRCDCGDQLKLAIARLAESGGLLLYLHQEGRGIGIANKLRAYRLQERGVDTYEANALLGFAEDERDFAIAGALLTKLGVTKIRLLTNNPHKLVAVEKTGIAIVERVPLVVPSGAHNHGYLEAKAKKSGHLF